MTEHRSLTIEQLRDTWVRIAGPLVAATTRPFMLTTSGTLIVESAGPWLNELESRAPAIIAALPLVDGNPVERIRFVYTPPTNPRPDRANFQHTRRAAIRSESEGRRS